VQRKKKQFYLSNLIFSYSLDTAINYNVTELKAY